MCVSFPVDIVCPFSHRCSAGGSLVDCLISWVLLCAGQFPDRQAALQQSQRAEADARVALASKTAEIDVLRRQQVLE
jgi:hypothetical protein